MNQDEFWQAFLEETYQDEEMHYIECFHFELIEKLANELLDLVLSGKKRDTASNLLTYEIEASGA